MQLSLFLFSTAIALDDICRAINNGLCTNCGQELIVEGFCCKECPNGYEIKGHSCIQNSSVIFTLKFFTNFENQSFYEENFVCFPDSDSPSVATKRGVFFRSESNICETKNKFLFGPKLMIVLWLRTFQSGNIFGASDRSLMLREDKLNYVEFSVEMMGARIENKINSSDQWMRIRCIIELLTFDSGSAGIRSDDQESTKMLGLIIKTFKRNSLIFGDVLQNSQGFIGFVYQANGYIEFNINLPQLKISSCNFNLSDYFCQNCIEESCIDDCCNHTKSTNRRRTQGSYYIIVNNVQTNVNNCPTYYTSSNSLCTWNNSVLEFSFYNNKSTFTDASGNVQLTPKGSNPVFQQSRGLYFNGYSGFSINSGMTLSPDNFIIFWFNLDQNSAKMVLLDKYVKLTIYTSNMILGIYENGYEHNTDTALNSGTWYEGMFTMIADDSKTTRMIINRVQVITTSIDSKITDDADSNPFHLGVDIDTLYYSGWIVYFLYSPSHTATASLTFTRYSLNSEEYIYMCKSSVSFDGKTCENVQFYNCFPCDPSCLTCANPSSNNCAACSQNTVYASNGMCSCSQGWTWAAPLCSRNYFTAGLSVNASDIAAILFSEPLVEQLSKLNISVSINDSTQSFSIIMVDLSNYFIEIDFVTNITQNSTLQISFLGNVVSQSYSLLSTINLTAILYARTLGGIQQCFGSIYTNCYTCAAPLTLCNSICYCNNSFYWNGTTCLPCSSTCQVCNGPLANNCLLQTISDSINVCSTGYFFQSDTCESNKYQNCFPCDTSCLTCIGPSDCQTCYENATLQSNKTCSCSQGWSGTPPLCSRNYFTSTLSVNASNVAKIVFSEILSQQLTNSNISVTINDLTQNFSISMIDLSNYLIEIDFVTNITQNSTLKITFLGNIFSQNYSLLSTLNLTTALYARTLGGIQQCFGSIYNNCYTCASPMTLCNNICYCNISFYWSGTTCSACYSSCRVCNGPSATKCLVPTIRSINTCSTGYFFHSDTCESITYQNCFPCDPSCLTCIGPDPTDCQTCYENATLQSNNTCSCSQGWSGTPPLCTRVYFTSTLSVNASDIAKITFSEPLAQQLSQLNISVSINDSTQSFSIVMVDLSNYFIEIDFVTNVTQNSTLQI